MYIYKIIKPHAYYHSFYEINCLRKLGQSFRSILTINHHKKKTWTTFDRIQRHLIFLQPFVELNGNQSIKVQLFTFDIVCFPKTELHDKIWRESRE